MNRAILLAIMLCGCAAGPDYTRPALPLPAEFDNATSEGTKAIDRTWWKAFQDSLLDGLVERALNGNQDLVAASARVDQAIAVLGGIEAAGLPAIDGRAGFDRRKYSTNLAANPPVGTPRQRDNAAAGLSLSYEIDIWGRARRAREASQAILQSGREALYAAELSVSALVVRTYVELRSVDTEWVASEDAVKAREESLRVAKLRESTGNALLGETARAEGARAGAITRLSMVRRQRAALENLLGTLVGDPSLKVAPSQTALVIPSAPAAGLPSSLLERRPDVRQAEQLAISANAQIGVAKASAFPALTLTAGLGSESRELSGLFASPAATSAVGLSIEQNILDWGRAGRATDAAEAAAKVAAATYAQAVLDALRETRDALVVLREATIVSEATERQAIAAEQLRNFAQKRFDAGEIGSAEFADARVVYADSVSAVASARRDRIHAHIQLVKALGGGYVGE